MSNLVERSSSGITGIKFWGLAHNDSSMDERGNLVHTLRKKTLEELKKCVNGASIVPEFYFDIPKVIHNELLKQEEIRLEIKDIYIAQAVDHFTWLLPGVPLNKDDRDLIDLCGAVVQLCSVMLGYVHCLRDAEVHTQENGRNRRRTALSQVWYELKWAMTIKTPSGAAAEIKETSTDASRLEKILNEHHQLLNPENLAVDMDSLDSFRDVHQCISRFILPYLNRVVKESQTTDQKGLIASLSSSRLMQFATQYHSEFLQVERAACKFISRRAKESELPIKRKYGPLHIVPTAEHNWLNKLYEHNPSEAFTLSLAWFRVNPNALVPQFYDHLFQLANNAMETEESTLTWTNLTDWGTRDEETELEELKPLINELFPPTEMTEGSEGSSVLDQESSRPGGDAFSDTMKQLCFNYNDQLLIRQIVKQTLNILPLGAFNPNAQEHLSSVLSLDIIDMLNPKPSEQCMSFPESFLVMPDCAKGECTFHINGAQPYLKALREPLIRVKNGLLKLAEKYSTGVLPQMGTVIDHINSVMSLSMTSCSGSVLLSRCEKLWEFLVDVWIKRYAQKSESFEQEVTCLAQVIRDLRMWAIDDWQYLCCSRQAKAASGRFLSVTALKLLAFALQREEDWTLQKDVELASFVDDQFRNAMNGMHVAEVCIFRRFLRALAGAIGESSRVSFMLERLYLLSEPYEDIITKWAKDEIYPLAEEILKVRRLVKLETHTVGRDKRNMFTKQVQVARCIRDIDSKLHLTAGSIIQNRFMQMTLSAKLDLWRGGLAGSESLLSDESESTKSTMSFDQAVAVLPTLFEELLEENSRVHIMRVCKHIKQSITDLVGLDNWHIYRRNDGVKFLLDLSVESRHLSSRLSNIIKSSSDFFCVEEASCDLEFLRCADWYSLLCNYMKLSLAKLSHLEREENNTKCRLLALDRDQGTGTVLIRTDGLSALRTHLSDLRCYLQTIEVITRIKPVNRNIQEELHVDVLLAPLVAVNKSLMDHETEWLTSSQKPLSISVISLVEWTSLVSNCVVSLSQMRNRIKHFFTLQGLDSGTIDKVRAKLRRLTDIFEAWSHDIRIAESNQAVVEELSDAQPILISHESSSRQSLVESLEKCKSQSDLAAYAVITMACVCSELARNGMKVLQEEEEEPDDKEGADDFVQGQGLAEGSGMKEAEEELENELDFDTLKENPTGEQQKQEEHVDEKEGKDVDMDFKGDLEDIPPPPKDADSDDNSRENDAEENFDRVDDGNVENVEEFDPQDDGIDQNEETREESNADAANQMPHETEELLANMDEEQNQNGQPEEPKNAEEREADENDHREEDQPVEELKDVEDEELASAEPQQLDAELDVDELLGDDPDAMSESMNESEGAEDLDSEDGSVQSGGAEQDMGELEPDNQDPTATEEEDKADAMEEKPENNALDSPDSEEDHQKSTRPEDMMGGDAEQPEAANDVRMDGANESEASGAKNNEAAGFQSGADQDEGTRDQASCPHEENGLAKTNLKSNSDSQANRNVKEIKTGKEQQNPTEQAANDEDLEAAQIDNSATDVANAYGQQQEEGHDAADTTEQMTGANPLVLDEDMEKTDVAEAMERGDNGGGANAQREVEDDAAELQQEKDAATHQLSWRAMEKTLERRAIQLCETLQTVLIPTNRGRYEGFFRTGKRLDMRQVLSFIASDYRKDKIWLRRNKLSKRDYEVILCIDNSPSMAALGAHVAAIETMMVVSMAMKRLQVGKIGLVKFGSGKEESVSFLLEPHEMLTMDRGEEILTKELTFGDSLRDGFNKSIPALLEFLSRHFEYASQSSSSVNRLVMILTDGRFNQNGLLPHLQRLRSVNVCPVLLFIDPKMSIYDVKVPVFNATGRGRPAVTMKPWLDRQTFPFGSYTVINDIARIDHSICQILKEWINL